MDYFLGWPLTGVFDGSYWSIICWAEWCWLWWSDGMSDAVVLVWMQDLVVARLVGLFSWVIIDRCFWWQLLVIYRLDRVMLESFFEWCIWYCDETRGHLMIFAFAYWFPSIWFIEFALIIASLLIVTNPNLFSSARNSAMWNRITSSRVIPRTASSRWTWISMPTE